MSSISKTSGLKTTCPSATFLGFHGERSTGDDALTCAIAWGMHERLGLSKVYIAADHRNLPVLPEPLRVYTPIPWLNRIRFRRTWRQTLAIRRSDIVLYAGGANLHEFVDFDDMEKLVALARKSGAAAVGAIGMSVGPFHTSRKIDECGRFLAKLDFLTLRDSDSYDIVSSYSLPYQAVLALDAALTLPPVYGLDATYKEELPEGTVDIGVALCDHHRLTGQNPLEDEKRRRRTAESLIEVSHSHPLRVTLYQFSGHPSRGDGLTVNSMAELLGDTCEVRICRYSPDPQEIWRSISKMHIMIAMRFHASVFSYSVGTPFVMLDYHPKCAALAKDLGIPRELVLNAHDFESADLVRAVELLLSPNRPRPVVKWDDAVIEARKNFTPFESLFGSGAAP